MSLARVAEPGGRMRSPAKSAGLRGWAVIASLVLTASLGGSGCANRPRPRPPTPPGAITNQQRIQAMLSIHAHARWPDANFKRLPFLELRDAVQILSRDHGPAADSRRPSPSSPPTGSGARTSGARSRI